MPCLKLAISGPLDPDTERRLMHALNAERGVYGVVVCHDTRGVEIDFEDDEVTVEHLIQVTRAAGFEAHLVA